MQCSIRRSTLKQFFNVETTTFHKVPFDVVSTLCARPRVSIHVLSVVRSCSTSFREDTAEVCLYS